jgi:hypothetical protein
MLENQSQPNVGIEAGEVAMVWQKAGWESVPLPIKRASSARFQPGVSRREYRNAKISPQDEGLTKDLESGGSMKRNPQTHVQTIPQLARVLNSPYFAKLTDRPRASCRIWILWQSI